VLHKPFVGRTANADAHLPDQGGVLGQGVIFHAFSLMEYAFWKQREAGGSAHCTSRCTVREIHNVTMTGENL